jgi:hypothetical protein
MFHWKQSVQTENESVRRRSRDDAPTVTPKDPEGISQRWLTVDQVESAYRVSGNVT